MFPAVTQVGASLGCSLTVPLKPNQIPPVGSSAARSATASPPRLTLSGVAGPMRFDTTTRRRLMSARDDTLAAPDTGTAGLLSCRAQPASLAASARRRLIK